MARRSAVGLIFVVVSLACMLAVWQVNVDRNVTPTSVPWADERLVPTETPEIAYRLEVEFTPASTSSPTPLPVTHTPTLTPTPITPQPTAALPLSIPTGERWRFGTLDRHSNLFSYDYQALNLGWVLAGLNDYHLDDSVELVYMIHVQGDRFSPEADQLRAFVAAHPGSTWEIGNEPDVIWQANSTPEEYAHVYHELYLLIKEVDPTAVLAAGVISQPTPMRLRYLDLVLEAYQANYGERMPVDIWAIHNAILREERGSWGVDIPPGIEENTGRLYEVADNARLDIFEQQLIDFRVWMRDRDYRDRPLILTEFSVLMPPDYGFPHEKVASFMTGAFDFMLTATDPETGYPPDGNRLVQRWVWYALAAEDYTTGNLFDPQTKEITPLGQLFADYVNNR